MRFIFLVLNYHKIIYFSDYSMVTILVIPIVKLTVSQAHKALFVFTFTYANPKLPSVSTN